MCIHKRSPGADRINEEQTPATSSHHWLGKSCHIFLSRPLPRSRRRSSSFNFLYGCTRAAYLTLFPIYVIIKRSGNRTEHLCRQSHGLGFHFSPPFPLVFHHSRFSGSADALSAESTFLMPNCSTIHPSDSRSFFDADDGKSARETFHYYNKHYECITFAFE